MATSVIKRSVAAVDKFSPSFTSIDDFKAFLANAADIGLVLRRHVRRSITGTCRSNRRCLLDDFRRVCR